MTPTFRATLRGAAALLAFVALGHRASAAPASPRTLDAAQFAGSDLGAQVAAADRALDAEPGTIVISHPGVVGAGVTLGPGHSLDVRAPVTFTADIILTGRNHIRCADANAVITTDMPDPSRNPAVFRVADVADDIEIDGCHFKAAKPGSYILHVEDPISNLRIHDNFADTVAILFHQIGDLRPGHIVRAQPVRSTGISINNNSSIFPPGKRGGYLVLLTGRMSQVTVSGNHFTGGTHGVQVWGGDGATYPSAEAIRAADVGNMTFTGNVCEDLAGSCIWGSMMHNVVMSANVADGAGDICFDAEGSAGVLMTGNITQHCANAAFAVFFTSFSNSITGNTSLLEPAGSPAVLTKNADPGVPGHQQGLIIANNQMQCATAKLCRGIILESNERTTIEGNQMIDADVTSTGANPGLIFRGNRLSFDVSTEGKPGFTIPPQVNGFTDLIDGNIIESRVQQKPETLCIASVSADFNNLDTYDIQRNQCIAWPHDISLINNGGNGGVPTQWRVHDNYLPHLEVKVGGTNRNTRVLKFGNYSDERVEPGK